MLSIAFLFYLAIGRLSQAHEELQIATVIRCPPRWIPMGPYCTATVSVIPYTECPRQRNRFREPHVRKSAYVPMDTGFCGDSEGTGPLLRCPSGLQLEQIPLEVPEAPNNRRVYNVERMSESDWNSTRDMLVANGAFRNDSSSSYLDPNAYDPIIDLIENDDESKASAYPMRDNSTLRVPMQYRCSGVDQVVLSAAQFQLQGGCPRGYVIKRFVRANAIQPMKDLLDSFSPKLVIEDLTEDVICESYPVVPPEPICPKSHRPSLMDYDYFSMLEIKGLRCLSTLKIKGRLWCPDSFILVKEPYPEVPFGHPVYPTTDLLEYDPHLFDNSGFLDIPGTSCVRSVVVNATRCTTSACIHPELHDIERELKKFAIHKLKRDPRYIKFDSIPNGKNKLFWSPKGREFPF